MFCINCGTQLPENAKFCVNCGYKLQNDLVITSNQNIIYSYDSFRGDILNILPMVFIYNISGFHNFSTKLQTLKNYEQEELIKEIVKLSLDVDILSIKNDLDFSKYNSIAIQFVDILNSDLNEKNIYVSDCKHLFIDKIHAKSLSHSLYELYAQELSSSYSNFISELGFLQSRKDAILKLYEDDTLHTIGSFAKGFGAVGLMCLNPLIGVPAAIGLFCREKSEEEKKQQFINEVTKHFQDLMTILGNLGGGFSTVIKNFDNLMEDTTEKVFRPRYEYYKKHSCTDEDLSGIYQKAISNIICNMPEIGKFPIYESMSPYLKEQMQLIIK